VPITAENITPNIGILRGGHFQFLFAAKRKA